MARTHSIAARGRGKGRPKKPHKDYPLSWHATGYWCKKIRGTLHYFGPRWGDPETALDEYLRVKDDLLAGRKPRNDDAEGFTVADAVNHFLTDRKHRLEAGELVQESFDDYHASCERIVKAFGRRRLVDDLRPEDFLKLRSEMAKGWGPVTLGNEVQRIRVVFNFVWQAGLIDRPVRYGPSFKRPSKRILRAAREKKGERLFEPKEVQELIEAAKPQLRAMILLGINCGFGNNDCARLPLEALDLEKGWLNFARPKTAIRRRCPLWEETAASIRKALEDRKPVEDASIKNLVFVTKYGKPWYKQTSDNPITKEFRKLLDELGIYRPGLSFYALRHTFETVAGESKDQVAVDAIMGHARDDMASIYRERISDERLVAVTEYVRQWAGFSRSTE